MAEIASATESMRKPGQRARAALLVALCLALASLPVLAGEPRAFPTPALAERFRGLVEEIRCLVCQNQSIADSNAELARDLRNKVDEMLRNGHTDEEILAYMVDRYGNFVRYRPPLDVATLLLWCGPFVLAGAALAWLLVRVRRRVPTRARLTDEERDRLAVLVRSERDPGPSD